MTLTVSDITQDADLFRRAYPNWPYPEPDAAVFAEVQVGWGEDTKCSVCLCDLPAGATAFEDGDGVLCVDCSAAEGTAA